MNIVLDHFVPNKDIKAAQQSLTCRKFARAHAITNFYDVGKMDIEHALLLEQGIVRGYTTAFIDAGCVVSTPTCGPCLGRYMGVLAEHERCVSTTNRNFVGRMGHVTSEVYLASPYTAAASALTGYITDPREA